METFTIIRGANVLLSRPLFQADGVTTLSANALTVCTCDLYQAGKVVKTLVRGTDPELRSGGDGVSLVLELTTALTALLKKGPLTEVYKLGVNDAAFTAEPGKSIPKLSISQVVIA